MIALSQFNSLSKDEAAGLLAPCVAIPAWGETLVSLRPSPAAMRCCRPPGRRWLTGERTS